MKTINKLLINFTINFVIAGLIFSQVSASLYSADLPRSTETKSTTEPYYTLKVLLSEDEFKQVMSYHKIVFSGNFDLNGKTNKQKLDKYVEAHKSILTAYMRIFRNIEYDGTDNKKAAWDRITEYFTYMDIYIKPLLNQLKSFHTGLRNGEEETASTSDKYYLEKNFAVLTNKELLKNSFMDLAAVIRDNYNFLCSIVENQRVGVLYEYLQNNKAKYNAEDDLYESKIISIEKERRPVIAFNLKRLFETNESLKTHLERAFDIEQEKLIGKVDIERIKNPNYGRIPYIGSSYSYQCDTGNPELIAMRINYRDKTEEFEKDIKELNNPIMEGTSNTPAFLSNGFWTAWNLYAYAVNSGADAVLGTNYNDYYAYQLGIHASHPTVKAPVKFMGNGFNAAWNLLDAGGDMVLSYLFSDAEEYAIKKLKGEHSSNLIAEEYAQSAVHNFMTAGVYLSDMFAPENIAVINRNTYIKNPLNLHNMKEYAGDDNVLSWLAQTGKLTTDIMLLAGPVVPALAKGLSWRVPVIVNDLNKATVMLKTTGLRFADRAGELIAPIARKGKDILTPVMDKAKVLGRELKLFGQDTVYLLNPRNWMLPGPQLALSDGGIMPLNQLSKIAKFKFTKAGGGNRADGKLTQWLKDLIKGNKQNQKKTDSLVFGNSDKKWWQWKKPQKSKPKIVEKSGPADRVGEKAMKQFWSKVDEEFKILKNVTDSEIAYLKQVLEQNMRGNTSYSNAMRRLEQFMQNIKTHRQNFKNLPVKPKGYLDFNARQTLKNDLLRTVKDTLQDYSASDIEHKILQLDLALNVGNKTNIQEFYTVANNYLKKWEISERFSLNI